MKFQKSRKLRFLKRAQTEMLGLALIVVLISIAMIFVIRFGVLDAPEEHKKQFTETEMASNLVSSILKTTTECRQLTFTELFQINGEQRGGLVNCPPPDSNAENYLDNHLDSILQDTLVKWNIKYVFDAKTDGNHPVYHNESAGGCPGEKTSKPFPVPIDAGGADTVVVKLDICS